jgi:hypothetical protein
MDDPNVDDRVIEWGKICPREFSDGAFMVFSCPKKQDGDVSQVDLWKNIKSKNDVVKANRKLRFMTHLRSYILKHYGSGLVSLSQFRGIHDRVNKTIESFNDMDAAGGGSGGGSAVGRELQAIANWLHDRQQDLGNSVMSCF